MQLEHLTPEARHWFEEGFNHHRQGELDEAIECYRRSLEAEPSAEAHTFLGWAYSHRKDLEAAIDECYKAIEVDPSLGNPYNDIGAYLIEMGRLDEAITWFERATKAERYESYHFPHLNLGRLYLRKGKLTDAVRELERALQIEPGYLPAKVELAKLQAMLN